MLRTQDGHTCHWDSKATPQPSISLCRHASPGAAPDGLIKLLPVSYAAFSGAIGTQAVLFAKMLSSLLRTSMKGQPQMGHPFSWAIAILLVLSATFWVTRLNRVRCPPHLGAVLILMQARETACFLEGQWSPDCG